MRVSALPDELSPHAIWIYYERSQVALGALRREILAGVAATLPHFGALSVPEADQALSEVRDELDAQVTTALVAAFEATIRVDFRLRAVRRPKVLSRRFRQLDKDYDKRVPFEMVVDAWTNHSGEKLAGEHLKKLYNYRHWLAHGRYWTQKSGLAAVDPGIASRIGTAFFQAHPEIDALI